ncbi:MAG: type VI secretion system accessory protein TagJ [Gemmatimonadota bacterium]
MDAVALYKAGKLDEAIEALGVALRSNPTDVQRRTFLFELLCFAGNLDRAEKQLDVISSDSEEAGLGAWLYRSALHGERVRQEMFDTGNFPVQEPPPGPVSGTLNGEPFETLTDADPRIGARLELLIAGEYTWIPFEHLGRVAMDPPKRLRDLLWAPVRVEPGPGMEELELGEVLLPVIAPLSWRQEEAAVRLGRVTDWVEVGEEEFAPVGQKLLLVDDEPFPILEVRELEITHAPDAGA